MLCNFVVVFLLLCTVADSLMAEVDPPWYLKQQRLELWVSVTTLPLPPPSDSPLLIVDFYENYIFLRLMDGAGRGRLWESHKEVLLWKSSKRGSPVSNFQ